MIGEDGKPIKSEVTQTTGFPALDAAGLEALSTCQFKGPETSWQAMNYERKLDENGR